jgi:hypothetical protein
VSAGEVLEYTGEELESTGEELESTGEVVMPRVAGYRP